MGSMTIQATHQNKKLKEQTNAGEQNG